MAEEVHDEAWAERYVVVSPARPKKPLARALVVPTTRRVYMPPEEDLAAECFAAFCFCNRHMLDDPQEDAAWADL